MEKGVTHLYQYLKTPSNKDIHKNHDKLRMMVYTLCASHIYNISYMILEKMCVLSSRFPGIVLNKHPFEISNFFHGKEQQREKGLKS